jgi:hypothetical protein
VTLTVDRYKAALLSLLPGEDRHSSDRREDALGAIRLKLYDWSEANPKIDLQRELDTLDEAYSALCAEAEPARPRPVPAPPAIPAASRPSVTRPDDGPSAERIALRAPEPAPARPGADTMAPSPARQRRPLPWLAGIAAVLGLAALVMALDARACGFITKRCHDSGWIALDSTATRTVRINHGLGAVPRELTLWFSPSQSGTPAMPLNLPWRSDAGAPGGVSATDAEIIVAPFGGLPIRGAWNAETRQWASHTSGFIRVIASK